MQKRSKAREALEEDRDFILFLFRGKCLKCGKPTNIIHEIIPISHGNVALHWTNRVPLCDNHHNWAHDIGTNNSIPILQEMRWSYLIRNYDLSRDVETARSTLEKLHTEFYEAQAKAHTKKGAIKD